MVVLDTEVISILEWESPTAEDLRTKLATLGAGEVTTTIISFEEQLRGWMSYLASRKRIGDQVDGYRRLLRQLRNYCKAAVLPFEERAAGEFQRLRKLRPRTATMDLKIASVVMANDATLWTRNTRDFDGIPGLQVRDWTK
jgi:tRNA(fMet)-specific endonuclease VapC